MSIYTQKRRKRLKKQNQKLLQLRYILKPIKIHSKQSYQFPGWPHLLKTFSLHFPMLKDIPHNQTWELQFQHHLQYLLNQLLPNVGSETTISDQFMGCIICFPPPRQETPIQENIKNPLLSRDTSFGEICNPHFFKINFAITWCWSMHLYLF